MANIKEVAKRAGCSAATVSKYLNGIHVKQSNAAAIDEAVAALGFKRNDIARGLRTNKSMTIGILLPQLDNMFFTSIISSIDSVLERHGYGTIVCNCRSDAARESRKLEFLLGKKIDGLIAVPCSSASEFVRRVGNLPVVLVDRMTDEGNCDCVLSDNAGAGRTAAERLIEAGHRKIGILLGPESMYTPVERRAGFMSACAEHEIKIPDEYIKTGEYNEDAGYAMTCSLLDLPVPPTAIFATNNELTVGAVTALNERGLTPGRDISFIGFDNLTLALSSRPRLTVIVQPVSQIGETAATTLLARLAGEPCGGVRCLKTTMRDYESVVNIKG